MKKKPDSREQPRSVQSRKAIMDAVVRIVDKQGFSGVTIANIVKESGLTSGVIQYQFGGKDNVFKAIIEESSDRVAQSLNSRTGEFNDLEGAVKFAVETLWSYYSQSFYRAVIEILLNIKKPSAELLLAVSDTRTLVYDAWHQIIGPYCPAATRKDMKETVSLMIAALRGIAIGWATIIKEVKNDVAVETDLATLRKLLVVYLQTLTSSGTTSGNN